MRISPSQEANDPQASDRFRKTAATDVDVSLNVKAGPPGVDGLSIGARSTVERGRARAHFNEAMASIPRDDRVEFGEAMARAPRLVEIESNPDHYLDHADFDPWKAAAGVAAYWKARVEFFGDRAFLPLTISGDGAMSPDDVELLQSGVFMVLPCDRQGRHAVR
jgi:hypothetical protein